MLEKTRGFEIVSSDHLKSYNNVEDVIFPMRGTKGSAGYDFYLPYDIVIKPKESIIVWSDIKSYMLNNEMLCVYPRSSVAIKRKIRITNIVGIIDSDYYNNPKNDGNIGLSLFNFGKEEQTFKKGEAIAQAIFQTYLIADNCNSDNCRIGGMGSTNK